MSTHISCLEGGQWEWVSVSKQVLQVAMWEGSVALVHTQYDPALCVCERHNDGCLQVALTTRLHCTTNHRYMNEGLCLLTCKEIGLFLKSMPQKNFKSFGQYIRGLATLNCNHTTGEIQPTALFTSDQVGLYQLSKNWG